MANSNLFAGIYAGLTNTYAQLAAQNPNGLTLQGISDARANQDNLLTLNQSFASYLQTNFTNIDKDGDGIISPDEMTNLTNMMSAQGLTRAELTQLYASGTSGLSDSTIQDILEHFDDMDTNHDGRITQEEISAYSVNSARQEKVDEYAHKAATNVSVFYGSESSSDSDSYSMLSYRYKKSNS